MKKNQKMGVFYPVDSSDAHQDDEVANTHHDESGSQLSSSNNRSYSSSLSRGSSLGRKHSTDINSPVEEILAERDICAERGDKLNQSVKISDEITDILLCKSDMQCHLLNQIDLQTRINLSDFFRNNRLYAHKKDIDFVKQIIFKLNQLNAAFDETIGGLTKELPVETIVEQVKHSILPNQLKEYIKNLNSSRAEIATDFLKSIVNVLISPPEHKRFPIDSSKRESLYNALIDLKFKRIIQTIQDGLSNKLESAPESFQPYLVISIQKLSKVAGIYHEEINANDIEQVSKDKMQVLVQRYKETSSRHQAYNTAPSQIEHAIFQFDDSSSDSEISINCWEDEGEAEQLPVSSELEVEPINRDAISSSFSNST